MEDNSRTQFPEEMRDLLRQMQRTTSLLYQRMAQASEMHGPAPPAATIAPNVLQHAPSIFQPVPSMSQCAPPQPYPSRRSDNVQSHLSRLFRPHTLARKRKHETPWSHVFCCLPEPETTQLPSAEESRFFEVCGLGKKNVQFPHNEGDYSFLSEHLFSAFPPLREAGGFVLALSSRSKMLREIPIPPAGYTLEYLRAADIKRAPIYVVPLQRSLPMNTPVREEPLVMERCLTCLQDLPLCDLPEHVIECRKEEQSRAKADEDEGDEDGQLALAIFQSLQPDEVTERTEQQQPIIVINEEEGADVHWPDEPVDNGQDQDSEGTSKPNLKSVLCDLAQRVDRGVAPLHNTLNVTRESILEASFRAFRRPRFSSLHRLNVNFVDQDGVSEGAVDDGGPMREFLRLLTVALRDSRYFEGAEDSKNLALVSRATEAGDYLKIGQMLSVALIHGGIQPCFFSARLYASVCQSPTDPVTLEEVSDWGLREKMQKIQDAVNFQEAQDAVMEASGLLSLLGCPGVLQSMEQKEAFVEEAARAYVEGRTKGALEQLIEGLDCLGVAEAMQRHPDLLRPAFVGGRKKLQVQDMLDLFEVAYSAPGSNARRRESQTISFWRDWLIDVEDGSRPVSLEEVLIFASGTDQIPPLGFPQKPTIEFNDQRQYPEANTCGVVLRLPVHHNYDSFVEFMESGIRQSPTFGFI